MNDKEFNFDECKNFCPDNIRSIINSMLSENTWWKGEIIYPENDKYDDIVLIFNPRTQTFPSVIVRPINHKEVCLITKYLHNNKIKYRIRSGGHSDEGYSSWNGVQIDVRLMKKLKITNDILTLEAGVMWAEVYEYLNNSKYIAIGGSAPSVSVIGFLLGGGFNHFLSRKYGLGSDNVLEFDIVLADGKSIKSVSKKNHKELFKALKIAGGGNFGIVTKAKLQLHLANESGENLFFLEKIEYNVVDLNKKTNIINTWHKWCDIIIENKDYNISSILKIESNSIIIKLCWIDGSKTKSVFDYYVNLLYKAIPLNYKKTITSLNWLDFCKQESEIKWEIFYPYTHNWFGPSALLSNLSDEIINHIVSNEKKYSTSIIFQSFKERNDDSIYSFRNSKFLINTMSFWKNIKENEEQIYKLNNWFSKIEKNEFYLGAYINYTNGSLTNWSKKYFGESLDKIRDVKNKYDPNNYWSFPQSISVKNDLSIINQNKFSPLVQSLIELIRKDNKILYAISETLEPLCTETENKILLLANYFENWLKLMPVNNDEQIYDSFFTKFYSNNKLNKSANFKLWLLDFVRERAQYMNSSNSKKILSFWKENTQIELENYIEPTNGYSSFNNFFTRRIKPEKIDIDFNYSESVVSPANCVLKKIDNTKLINIKGEKLNIKKILNSTSYAKKFNNSLGFYCYLSPTDYHRWHSPVNGQVILVKEIRGNLWPIEGIVDDNEFYSGNQRVIFIIETITSRVKRQVALIAVGNSVIGSVNYCVEEFQLVKKGDELGFFAYGGSAILLLFENESFKPKTLNTDINYKKMGEKIGYLIDNMIDVLIPVAKKDLYLLQNAINKLIENSLTPIRKIFVVLEDDAIPVLNNIDIEIVFLNERIYPFSKDDIKEIILNKNGDISSTSWYFQQLLKLYSFRVITDVLPRLLIHDVDIYFNKKIEFINQEGKSILSCGYPFYWVNNAQNPLKDYVSSSEHTHSHIHHAKKLITDFEIKSVYSGMHHHQLIESCILEEFLSKVENKFNKKFWYIFINEIDQKKWTSASEYVLYLHYALKFHRNKVLTRHVSSVELICDANIPNNYIENCLMETNDYEIVGRHKFNGLKKRFQTMDYFSEELRQEVLNEFSENNVFLFKLYSGVLNISKNNNIL